MEPKAGRSAKQAASTTEADSMAGAQRKSGTAKKTAAKRVVPRKPVAKTPAAAAGAETVTKVPSKATRSSVATGASRVGQAASKSPEAVSKDKPDKRVDDGKFPTVKRTPKVAAKVAKARQKRA